jgi:hypothetical protein
MVVVEDTQNPTNEEWQRYLDVCVEIEKDYGSFDGVSALIFSDGGAPTSQHRVSLGKILKGRTVPSAVVSDSLVVRASLSIFQLINPGIHVYPSRDWQKAAAFAGVAPAKQLEALKVAVALGREVGDPKVLRAIGL